MKKNEYKFEKSVLGNGIEVYVNEAPEFNTCTVLVDFYTPMSLNPSASTMLAKVLSSYTDRHPTTRDLQMALDDLYGASLQGAVKKRGSTHISSININTLTKPLLKKDTSDPLKESMKILSDAVKRSKEFNPVYVDIEKNNLKNEIMGIKSNKEYFVGIRLYEIMFDGQPTGRLVYGDAEEVEKIDAGYLSDYYNKFFTGENLRIFSCGKGKEADIIEGLSPLSEMQKGSRLERQLYTPDVKISAPVSVVKEEMDIAQAGIAIGYKLKDLDLEHSKLESMSVFNVMFGSSPSSKLFTNVREKESLAYSIGSSADTSREILMVTAGVNAEKVEKAVTIISEEINKMKRGEFSRKDFQVAKNYAKGIINSHLEDQSNRIEYAKIYLARNLSPDLTDLSRSLSEVTYDDVMRVADSVDLKTQVTYLLVPRGMKNG